MHPKGNNQLRIQKMVCPSYISVISILFSVIISLIPLNKQYQMSNIENTQIDSSILRNNNASSINITNIKFKT